MTKERIVSVGDGTARVSKPIAKHQHDCFLCGLPIAAGEQYYNWSRVHDAYYSTWKLGECKHLTIKLHLKCQRRVDVVALSEGKGGVK